MKKYIICSIILIRKCRFWRWELFQKPSTKACHSAWWKFSVYTWSQLNNLGEINLKPNIALKYIQINFPPAKLLIETGASKSLLNPDLIEMFYPYAICQSTMVVKSIHNTEIAHFQVAIALPKEFINTNENIISYNTYSMNDIAIENLPKISQYHWDNFFEKI